MSDTPSFASTREALGLLHAVMGYLSADAGEMAADAQAECLQELERLDGVKTATRARVLGAFTAGQGYAADADYSPRSWLIHRTRVTKGTAAMHLARVRRAAGIRGSSPRWPRELTPGMRRGGDRGAGVAVRPVRGRGYQGPGAAFHDALAEAMRRLIASDLVPERAGQPVKAMVHVSLAELLRAMDDWELEDQWAAEMRVGHIR